MSIHERATSRAVGKHRDESTFSSYSEKDDKQKMDEFRPQGLRKWATVPSSVLSIVASLSYGLTSLAMVFLNKGLLIQFKYSITILTLQMVSSVTLIHIGSALKLVNVRPFNTTVARRLLPLSLFYNANVAFALASLSGINIPMYIALKRLTPMAVLIGGVFTGKAKPALQVTLSVLTTVIGCLIAAIGDFSFDLTGYGLALLSVLFQTMYLLLVERSGAEDGISSTELMLYNGILSFPVLAFLLIVTGEGRSSLPLLVSKLASSPAFAALFAVSLSMGILLNFTMFLCTIVNSALTTTIVGVLKGVGSTTLGFFLFGGVEVHALNISGLVVNSVGGIWYSYAKFTQARGKARKPLSEPLLPTSVPPRPLS